MIKNNKAITLVELIVASLISTVVIMGLFTVLQSTQNAATGFGERNVVNGATQATLNHIMRNAAQVVGSGVGNNKGILIGVADGLANNQSFCFAQDTNNPPDAVGNIWICYTQILTNLYQCSSNYVPGVNPRGATVCPNTSTFIGTLNANVIAATNNPNTVGTLSNPSFVGNSFLITISDTVNNKSQTIKGSASPAGHSSG